MLISPAHAQAAAGGQPDFLMSLLPLVLIFVVFWFLLIRPQQRKMKDHRAMVAAVKKGDRIVTAGGLIGTVAKVEDADNIVIAEVAQNVRVRLVRSTISEVLKDKTQVPKAANDDGTAKGGLLAGLFGRK